MKAAERASNPQPCYCDCKLFNHSAIFLTVAFTRERRFKAALFAGRDIEGVSFHFANNIFLLHLTLKATESAFQRLIVAQLDFCHSVLTCLSFTAQDVRLEMLKRLVIDAMKGYMSAVKRTTSIIFHQR